MWLAMLLDRVAGQEEPGEIFPDLLLQLATVSLLVHQGLDQLVLAMLLERLLSKLIRHQLSQVQKRSKGMELSRGTV